eukprot:754294-Hanusia_phi.AAC.1
MVRGEDEDDVDASNSPQVAEAYEVLSDPKKKSYYDRFGDEGVRVSRRRSKRREEGGRGRGGSRRKKTKMRRKGAGGKREEGRKIAGYLRLTLASPARAGGTRPSASSR